MKKIIISITALVLALAFVGCTPATDIMLEDTTEQTGILISPDSGNVETSFKDYVICSDNFAFYTGEYYYFFMQLCSDAIESGEYDIDPDKSLKTQYISSDKTWFDALRELSLEYMKELLYVYELALKADNGVIGSADRYIYDNFIPYLESISNGKPSEYVSKQFGGVVSYQNYLTAIKIEYIYNTYMLSSISETEDVLTSSEVKEYAEKNSFKVDELPTKKAVCVSIKGGKTKTEEFMQIFKDGGELTAKALKSLADSKGHVYFEDVFVKGSESNKEITKWLFESATEVGAFDSVYAGESGYYVVFYESDGEATYLHLARQELAEKKVNESFSNGAKTYKFNISSEKLNSINV